jgi:hypothetical protein
MTAAPKPPCPKCGGHKWKNRLPPLTRQLTCAEAGREYSSITWWRLTCQLCGAHKAARVPNFVENPDKVGAPMPTSTGKIAKDKTSSQPKTSAKASGGQRSKNRRSQ